MNIDLVNLVLRYALGAVPRNVTITRRHVEILTAAGLIVRAPLGELLGRPRGFSARLAYETGHRLPTYFLKGHGHSLLLQALHVVRRICHGDA